MQTTTNLSLKERLQGVTDGSTGFPFAFEAYVDEYFKELCTLSGTSYFKTVYRQGLCRYLSQCGTDCILAEMVSFADSLCPNDKTDLLYRLLAEPFTFIKKK